MNTATNTETTTWSVKNATQLLMAATVQIAGGVTTTSITYGTALTGARHGDFVADGKTYSGTLDGRALVPINIATYTTANGIKFADQKPAPTLLGNAAELLVIHQLLAQAGSDAPSACAHATPTANRVVTAAKTALLQNVPGTTAEKPPVVKTPLKPIVAKAAAADPGMAEFGPKANTTGSDTDQNSPLDWVTPHCEQCQHDCITNPISWITLGVYEFLCSAGCFSPSNGCGQDYCSIGKSCDNDQQCCGSQCCGGGNVCGRDEQGACCPSDFPVGCGDSTGVTCFPAGTTCCGDLEYGCKAGYACVNVTGVSASCCPVGQMAKSGECCSHPLCNGECCGDGQACVNGACCGGPTDKNGACCGALSTVCNGSCCNGTCGSQGQCCPLGFPNCGAPPTGTASLLFWSPTANTGTLGGQSCNGSPCNVEVWGNPFWVHGAGFQAGIPVQFDVSGSRDRFTGVPDAAGTFSIPIAPTPINSGAMTGLILATQHASNGVRMARLVVSFINPNK